ncbi:MAG: hypothetical protein M3N24_03345 [Actinomycetota bacterium]|nr:hypothetical protein [Actinomycetota bacterium]
MGQGTDQTVRQIEDARERLGTELSEFEERLPNRLPTGGRAVLPIAGAVAATGATVLVVRGVRGRARARAAARRLPARIIGRVLPGRVGRSRTETPDDRWKLWAAAAGGVWLAVRLAQLQQLRRLNRTLVVR